MTTFSRCLPSAALSVNLHALRTDVPQCAVSGRGPLSTSDATRVRRWAFHLLGHDPQTVESVRSVARPLELSLSVYPTADGFLNALDDLAPACVITEMRLIGMDAIELIEILKQRPNYIPVVVLTGFADVRGTVAAMRAGAQTVLEKPFREMELWDAVREALAIEEKVHKSLQHRREVNARLERLTEQERAVLQLMIDGLPNKTIASRLDVSLRTVEGRRREVFTKLRADSLAQVVRLVTAATRPCRCGAGAM